MPKPPEASLPDSPSAPAPAAPVDSAAQTPTPVAVAPAARKQLGAPNVAIDPAINCAVEKCAALTFDDGPKAKTTTSVLDTLKRNNVHGTFFVLGSKVAANSALILRMKAEGHEIGNHTWSHPQLSKLTRKATASEIRRTQDAIKAVTGTAPIWLRPPYGDKGGSTVKVATDNGLAISMWSTDTFDWKNKSPQKSESNALTVRPGGIILMHDIHSYAPDMLDDLIKKLVAQGYHLVTVSQLMDGTNLKAGASYGNRKSHN